MGLTREEIAALPPDPDTQRTHVLKAGDKVHLRDRFLQTFQRCFPGLRKGEVFTIELVYYDLGQLRFVVPGIGVARKSHLKWINPNPVKRRRKKVQKAN